MLTALPYRIPRHAIEKAITFGARALVAVLIENPLGIRNNTQDLGIFRIRCENIRHCQCLQNRLFNPTIPNIKKYIAKHFISPAFLPPQVQQLVQPQAVPLLLLTVDH
jgi:hypothetical protein